MRWMPGAISIVTPLVVRAAARGDRVAAVDAQHLAGDVRGGRREQPRHVAATSAGVVRTGGACPTAASRVEPAARRRRPARRDDVRAHAARPALERGDADERLQRHAPGTGGAAAGNGCVPRIDVTATQPPSPLERGGEPRLRREERLRRPSAGRRPPRVGLRARRAGASSGSGGSVTRPSASTLSSRRARGRAPRARSSSGSSWADDEDAHQYFPITRPPSTRR